MTWACVNGCHEDDDYFTVEMWESRTDLIVHSHAPDDEKLDDEQGEPKVYVGGDNETVVTGPWCHACEAEVVWAKATGEVKE